MNVPMKNIRHNSYGSWMFFRLNVKWRKLQGKSEDRIMKYSRMIAVCMLWPWTDGLQSLVSYSEWRGISMAASSTSTSPLPMNSWFYTGLQTVPASGRDWRCQWGKSGLFMWLCVDVEYAAESSERGITLSWISDVFIDMYKWSKQSAPPKQLFLHKSSLEGLRWQRGHCIGSAICCC